MADGGVPGHGAEGWGRETAYAHWCVTVNNYTREELERLWRADFAVYIIIGDGGRGPGDTPHLQVYMEVEPRKRWGWLHYWLPRAHFERRHGSGEQAREYCTKEGVYRERGTLGRAGTPNARWAGVVEAIQAKATWREVLLDPALVGVVGSRMAWAQEV